MIKNETQIGRSLIALSVLFALLFASAISATPQLHKRIHSGEKHECAVSLITSGSCDRVSAPLSVAPYSSRCVTILISFSSRVTSRALEFSKLEHAPPAIS